ncbi:uncharacterized protein LOC135486623 [Lineus longissimus]|uniref:uncharacterized protein LOC135486623 n=1 Tax=Lineus longissimus TaxID=88925 RepID=UPI00315D224B
MPQFICRNITLTIGTKWILPVTIMIQAAPASRPEATSQPVNNRKSVKAKKRKASKGKASKAKGDYCAAERIDNYDPKNNTYYIKWQGYDASHNSWVKAEDVTSPLISSYKEKLGFGTHKK